MIYYIVRPSIERSDPVTLLPSPAFPTLVVSSWSCDVERFLRSNKKAAKPTTVNDPRIVPTATPALAPVDSPPLPEVEDKEEAEDAEVSVALAVAVELMTEVVELPLSKSEAVTLKHGTEISKSASSTNV